MATDRFTAAIAWSTGVGGTDFQERLYRSDGINVTESTSNGYRWLNNGQLVAPGQHVCAVTAAVDEGEVLTVFCIHNGKTEEWNYYDALKGLPGSSDFRWENYHLDLHKPNIGEGVPLMNAAVRWRKSVFSDRHTRLYTCDGKFVRERCSDGKGWTTGEFVQPGECVSASIFDTDHIRVFCTNSGSTTEWCYDGKGPWSIGVDKIEEKTGFKNTTVQSAAVSVKINKDVYIHLFTCDGSTIREHCYDKKDGWHRGNLAIEGQYVSAFNHYGTIFIFVTKNGITTQWKKNIFDSRGWVKSATIA